MRKTDEEIREKLDASIEFIPENSTQKHFNKGYASALRWVLSESDNYSEWYKKRVLQ